MKQSNTICKKCGEDFVFSPSEIYWDENGTVSTKLVKCPQCGCPNVIMHWEERYQRNGINNDPRYYKR